MNTSEPNRDLQHTRVIHNKLILQALISQKRQSLLWVAESPLRVAERPTGGKYKPKNVLNSGSFAFRATKQQPREGVKEKACQRTSVSTKVEHQFVSSLQVSFNLTCSFFDFLGADIISPGVIQLVNKLESCLTPTSFKISWFKFSLVWRNPKHDWLLKLINNINTLLQ